MPKFKPQYRRLLFIDSKLRENSYPNSVSLAQEWEVSGRTISRDIDYLRDELGAPIEYDRAHNGYYLVRFLKTYHLGPSGFSGGFFIGQYARGPETATSTKQFD